MTTLSDLGLNLPLPANAASQQKRVSFSETNDVRYMDDDDEDDDFDARRPSSKRSASADLLHRPVWTVEIIDALAVGVGAAAAWYSSRIPVIGGMIGEMNLVTKIILFSVAFRVLAAVLSSMLNRKGTSSRRRSRR